MKLSDVLKIKVTEKGELSLDAIETRLLLEWLEHLEAKEEKLDIDKKLADIKQGKP